ncbi:MAG: hypothetical protein PHG67_07295, partial [Bacteroidales bacterium]|nr:hypothetical protein [Bacteroidales bacterium]
ARHNVVACQNSLTNPNFGGGQYAGMGGQLDPEWGVSIVRNLHVYGGSLKHEEKRVFVVVKRNFLL